MTHKACRADPVPGSVITLARGGKQHAECRNCHGAIVKSLYSATGGWRHTVDTAQTRSTNVGARG